MKVAIGAVAVAVTLLLGAIAFDLHQVAVALGRFTGTGAYAQHMTLDDTKAALKRQDREMQQLFPELAALERKSPRTSSGPQPHRSE